MALKTRKIMEKSWHFQMMLWHTLSNCLSVPHTIVVQGTSTI